MAIPTVSDKVILVDFSLTETNAFSLQPIDTQRQFSTTDRGTAFIGFKSENIANGMTADISLANLDDDSRVNRTFTVTNGTNFDATNKIFYYQIPDDEIVHWGNWIGYGKFTDGATSKTWTGTKLKYSISRDITNDPETKLIVMDDVNSFIASMQTIKNEMEADHAQALLHQTNYAGLLEDGVMTTQIIAKLTELESTYAPDLFSVKQQLADKAQSSQIKDTINAKVSQGIATKRKPMLVITLDDGSALEYTLSKPLFDSLNVKPTIYINTSPSFTSRLTPAQLKEMYAQGWEIASHTRNHVFLAEIATPAGFTVGATQIEIWTTPTYKYIDIFADVTTNISISDGSGSTQSETVDVTAVSAITNGKLTLTLATPLKNSYTTPVVRYSDKFIEDQYKQPIDYLNALNIPCSHLAYPYGAMSPVAMELAAKHYASARGAFPINDGTTFSNGGIVRSTENALMQYNILCGDLSNSSTSYIDTLLNQTVAEQGFAVLLGHGDVFDSWNTQFIYAVNKARELGIEIVTMGEALKWHGNLLDLGKDGFKISRSGLMRGNGINVLSPGKIAPSPSVWGFKEGWTFVRVEASDGLVGFPETAGTYVYLRTSSGNEGNGWNPQYFYGKTNKIYYRNSLTTTTHTPWVELRKGSVQQSLNIPTFDVGAGGTYHYATGIDVGTNFAVVIATAMSNNFIADLIYNNVFMATKMEAGMAYLSFVNRGAVTFSVPATTMNVEVIPK